MNRIDRLSAILVMLQTKKLVVANEIADRFDISLRTVYRDIKALYEAGIPIGAEAGKGYYIVDGYHLPPVMFTPEEAGSMLIAEKLVRSFSDKSVKDHFQLAADKIKSVLPEAHKEFIGSVDSRVEILHKPFKTGSEFSNNHINTIQKALSANKCLKLTYFSKYKAEDTSRAIEPMGLYFYSYSWHLIAFCKLRNDFRDFRLDRIKELSILDECVKTSTDFSIDQYFKDAYSREELHGATIGFKKSFVNEIESTRYYFGYYKEEVKDDAHFMTFAVNDYNYITGWLISLGDNVLSISPKELLDKMVSLARTLQKKYLQ